MREDRLTGKLTGPQMLWMHLILGELDGFSYAVEGSTVEFILIGKSRISVSVEGERVSIEVTVNLSALGNEAVSDGKAIARLIADEIKATIGYCQSIPADPFGFSDIASREFLTRSEWRRYDWLKRFANAEVKVNVNIISLAT